MSIPQYQLLAKQAIYNKQKDCVGHELLFRSPLNIGASDVGGDLATQQVLVNYCSSITASLEQTVGPVFLNVDVAFLLDHDSLPVDPEAVYIEVNGFSALNDFLTEALLAWRSHGFKLGLTNFDFSPAHSAALEYFDFVKVDMLIDPRHKLEQMDAFRKTAQHLWIAERIETDEVFNFCVEAGFDMFQGYFLARPRDMMGAAIRPGNEVTIQIVKELDRSDISMDQIAELVARDPKLAVQMLKIINSPLFALPKVVDDLKDALVFLGVDMLRHWAMILAFLSNGSAHIEASRIILNRAKTCEILCHKVPENSRLGSTAFLVGLVSGVDVLVSVTPKHFLQQVELSEIAVKAILNQEGVVGRELRKVLDLEHTISQQHFKLDALDEALIDAYREADAWVDQVVSVLNA